MSQEDNEDGYLRRYKEWYYYLYEYGPSNRYEQEKACTLHEILRTAQYLSMHESDGRELRATKRHTNNEKPIVSTMCQQLSQRVYHQAQAGRGYECADYRSTTVPVVLRATAYLRPMTNGHWFYQDEERRNRVCYRGPRIEAVSRQCIAELLPTLILYCTKKQMNENYLILNTVAPEH